MITEHALIAVQAGSEAAFEEAFASARRHIETSPGCLGTRLLREVEDPARYLLLVEWARLEDHTEVFRSSPAFLAWREAVSPFFADAPEVTHFDPAR